jgi:hypothetical protein
MNKFSLDEQPKITSGFSIPTDYFDSFPATVLQKTGINLPTIKPVFIWKSPAFAAAAVFLIALSIPFFWNDSVVSVKEIDTVALENYLSYQSTITSYDLINLLESQELDALQTNMNLEDNAVENILITNPDFENYITE